MIEDSTLLSIRAIHNPNSISHIHVHIYPSTPIYAYVRTYICIYMNMTDVEMHARTDMAKFNQNKEAYLRIYPYLSHTDHPNTPNLPLTLVLHIHTIYNIYIYSIYCFTYVCVVVVLMCLFLF